VTILRVSRLFRLCFGTQFDGPGHLGIGDLYYNGNNRADFAKPEGLIKLGVENVWPIVTRGILIDVAGCKEVVMVGADNWGVEVSPNPNPELAVPVHQLLIGAERN
jgi:hypothetical protein